MTVKTGSSWAGTFVTLDATGALAAGTPSGVLYVDGTANGATVTITGSNPYKWAVTLPTLTAGQRVDMYITATIATIGTAGFVASDQADTALVSDVKADTAAILDDTGTDGVVLKADAVTEITDDIFAEVVENSLSYKQVIQVMAAVLAGKVTGGATGTITFKDLTDAVNRVVMTVDSSGNRSAVTTNFS